MVNTVAGTQQNNIGGKTKFNIGYNGWVAPYNGGGTTLWVRSVLV